MFVAVYTETKNNGATKKSFYAGQYGEGFKTEAMAVAMCKRALGKRWNPQDIVACDFESADEAREYCALLN